MTLRLRIAALTCLGLSQILATELGAPRLAGLAAATAAAPAPKVFASAKGLETFSSDFAVEWRDGAGELQRRAVDSERYAGLLGPYNRRNAYGAAIAYGPVLASDPRSAAMLRAVARYAFCDDAPVLEELGLEAARGARELAIVVQPLRPVDLPLRLDVSCSEEGR